MNVVIESFSRTIIRKLIYDPKFNDSPTFSSRPNNMVCPTLQNKLFSDELLSGGESLSSEPFLQVGNRK